MKAYLYQKRRKGNMFMFMTRKQRKELEAEEERKRLIEEWLRTHEVTRLEPGCSHMGYQS